MLIRRARQSGVRRRIRRRPSFFILTCLLAGLLSAYLAGAAPQPMQDEAFQRGLAALQEDRIEAALEALTAAEHQHPVDARVRNFRGIALARLGRNPEAAAEYGEAIRLDPRMPDAYRNLGFLDWREHLLDEAREQLERAVKLSPGDSFAHYYLGRVQLDAQRYAEGFQELKISAVPWPDDADFLLEAATGYIALGQQEDARQTLAHVQRANLSDAQAVRLGAMLLDVHDNDRALGIFRKLNHPPTSAKWAEFDAALASLLTGSYEAAVQQALPLTRRTAPPAEAASPWSLLGIAYARLGQGSLAADALRHAASLAPAQEEYWLNLTRELMEVRRYADAISAAEEAAATNPKSYALQLRLGAANLAADHYPQAERAFRELVAAGDPLPTSYVGLAQVLLRTGRAEEAASELGAAQEKIGPNFLLAYFLGLALARAGKPAGAIPAFQQAVRLSPKSAEAHLELGKTQLAAGQTKNAIAELTQALRLSPGNPQAQRLLSQAYRRADDAKSALQYAEQAAETSPAPAGDLVGDFLLPPWQFPTQGAEK